MAKAKATYSIKIQIPDGVPKAPNQTYTSIGFASLTESSYGEMIVGRIESLPLWLVQDLSRWDGAFIMTHVDKKDRDKNKKGDSKEAFEEI